MVIHQDSLGNEDDLEKLYGENTDDPKQNTLLSNALRSLRNNNSNPEMILLNSKIINKCFPGTYAPTGKEMAQKLKF